MASLARQRASFARQSRLRGKKKIGLSGSLRARAAAKVPRRKSYFRKPEWLITWDPSLGALEFQGKAAELNSALGVGLSERGGVLIPWDVWRVHRGDRKEGSNHHHESQTEA